MHLDKVIDGDLIVGIDIGGTFTDVCAMLPDGTLLSTKVSSTPPNFEQGFLGGIAELARELGVDGPTLLKRVSRIAHGMTVATNALLTRDGDRVGLIATAGHGEASLIMRGGGRTAGVLPEEMLRVQHSDKPEPFVPRSRIREVPERIDRNGAIVAPLNEGAVRQAVTELVAEGVESFAVALLWSIRNPVHENRIAEIIREVAGDEVHVTLSSGISDRVGEYERSVGAIMNAFVADRTNRYLARVETSLRDQGFTGPLMIMQCAGGVATIERIADAPITTLQSGPVGGVIGSTYLASTIDRPNLITTDLGGTSFDVALIIDGAPERASGTVLDRFDLHLPTVDVRSVGAGGGSIARFDEASGSLRVGPQSAGAMPGPACYGRGGTEPTVTDASLVLGYIDAEYFVGTRMKLDLAAARAAIEPLGVQLGMSIEDAAAGIISIAEHLMADLIRGMTVERGYDPRDFDVLAFGGAGPQHAGNCAQAVGARSAIVPLGVVSSTWSALGVAAADLTASSESGQRMSAPFDLDALDAGFEELARDVAGRLATDAVTSELQLGYELDVQYTGQIHQLTLTLDRQRLSSTEGDFGAELSDSFTSEYARLYGDAATLPGTPVEIVVSRANGTRATTKPGFAHTDSGNDLTVQVLSRAVYWPSAHEWQETPVYRIVGRVPSGQTWMGPGIVEMPHTTLVVHPGQIAETDLFGNIIVTFTA
ncbi:hydantoinase/oxoprolinase family protein [Salinibacterium sp. ZJ454]|uniref:hydantoinase/oxoprolinase family protein n=1 Tax=Salinibacterium sp. ZJ454 TaxID=2708339 RepID=UPI0014221851|nr:hydantoinase/oxoprolinase family protein [Salinibacterium sp. ZJ454]